MTKNEAVHDAESLTCGLIMPISAIDGCSAEHWSEVKGIICDAVADVADMKFNTKLVSEQDDVGVIQKRIVNNIYDSDIVICDVSCKNANVMFELGMRLAFDKPTILIKDDVTDFSFDTGVIEHLLYPRDLRFSRIVIFKKLLAEKLRATYKASKDDPGHSTFLKHFGTFKIASVNETFGTPDQVMIDMIQDLSNEVARMGRRFNTYLDAANTHDPSIGIISPSYSNMSGNQRLRLYSKASSLISRGTPPVEVQTFFMSYGFPPEEARKIVKDLCSQLAIGTSDSENEDS